MDTITQGLLGAVTAQLGFRQRIGRDATWVAAVAAVVPDLDLLVGPILSLTGAEQADFDMFVTHRGLSHSLFVIPVVGFVITVLWWWFKRPTNSRSNESLPAGRGSFGVLYACVLVALLSSPILDWCTSYGTQLFAPLSRRRCALDAVPIIDIIYTPILILTLLGCYIARKLKRKAGKATLKIAWIGFLLSAAYIGCGLGVRAIVLRNVRAHFEGVDSDAEAGPAEYAAYPQLPTIFVWRVTRRDEQKWMAMRVNVLFGVDVGKSARSEAAIVDNKWVRRARQLREIKVFEWFAMGRTRAKYVRQDGRAIVEFHDMRYGVQPESVESLWSARVRFDESGTAPAIEQVRHYHGRGLGQVARQVWGDLWRQ